VGWWQTHLFEVCRRVHLGLFVALPLGHRCPSLEELGIELVDAIPVVEREGMTQAEAEEREVREPAQPAHIVRIREERLEDGDTARREL